MRRDVQRIASRHNERLREVTRLIASSRERRKTGRCVLEGAHLVRVYCERVGSPRALFVVDEASGDPEVQAIAAQVPPSRAALVSRTLFSEIASMPPEVGVLAVVDTPPGTLLEHPSYCLVLEDVQDPGNVGTIIRTAAAAGVEQVLLSPGCAFAWSPKALRAGQGAHFLTAIVEDADVVDWSRRFRDRGGRTIATVVADGTSIYDADLRGPIAVALGSEGRGLSPALLALADVRGTIPMAPGSESLNAAAAAAVALFEAKRQREGSRIQDRALKTRVPPLGSDPRS